MMARADCPKREDPEAIYRAPTRKNRDWSIVDPTPRGMAG